MYGQQQIASSWPTVAGVGYTPHTRASGQSLINDDGWRPCCSLSSRRHHQLRQNPANFSPTSVRNSVEKSAHALTATEDVIDAIKYPYSRRRP